MNKAESLEYDFILAALPYCALSLGFVFICAGIYMNYKLNKLKNKKRKCKQ